LRRPPRQSCRRLTRWRVQDFFYICPSHLKDAGFCTPKIDQAAVEARRKKELDDEVARVKKEYEEKQRKKKEEKEKKEKEKEKGKDKKDKKEEDDKKDKPEVRLHSSPPPPPR